MHTALGIAERNMLAKPGPWATASPWPVALPPALFYGERLMPLSPDRKAAAAYLNRLKERPSFARVLKEAEPYFKLTPG